MNDIDLQEILFTTDLSDQKTTCTAWDFRTGTELMTYKGGGIANEKTLCFTSDKYIITGNKTKPLIHIWPLNSQNPIPTVRFVTPGKVGALAISPNGNYIVAGIQESLFVWHLSSGRLINTVAKHYQRITCLRFTDDGSFFASGGHDGGINIWNMTQLVSRCDDHQKPFAFYNDHDLPITDMYIGAGGLRGNLFSVSLDCSCKMYDLSSGTMLLNAVFPDPLNSIIVNRLETCIYVGSVKGRIHRIHIDTAPRTREYDAPKNILNEFIGHESKITAMALSLDGETLMSGGEDGNVFVWYIPSAQIIKTIPHKGSISNLSLLMMRKSTFRSENKFINKFANTLNRMIDLPNDEKEFFIDVFPDDQDDGDFKIDDDSINECGRSNLSNLNANSKEVILGNSSNSDEAANLRKEVERLKLINKKLFEEASRNILRNQNGGL